MVGTGVVTGISIAHERADLATIEAACADGQAGVVRSLLADAAVTEAFALQTCNRAEAYVVAEDGEAGRAALEPLVAGVEESAVRWLGHEEGLRHLMRVACGLESIVVGEDQILGQVRDAYVEARDVGGIGPVFEDAVTKAIHVGKRARTETAINEGATSLGSAAADVAALEVALESATALVVGTGEMGTLAARALADRVDHLVVANRTLRSARHVAETLSGDGLETSAVGLGALPTVLAWADVAVTATGAEDPVVDAGDVATAGETVLIDIARPRDVDPATDDVDGVTVRDLDDLQSVTERTAARRAEAAREVEAMIDREFDRLISQFKRKRADEVISAMYESAERTKRREVGRALSKLEADDLTDDQRETVEAMADALVGQLLAAPTKSLRDAAERDDWSTINTAIRLFDPHGGAGGADGSVPNEIPDLEEAGPEDVPEGVRDAMPQAVLDRIGED